MPHWGRVIARIILAIFLLLIVAYLSLAWYINTHKKEVLAQVTATLNEDIKGTLAIGDLDPTFLGGFPHVSLRLQNVVIRDSLYASHKHTFLNAGDLSLSVNPLALIRGAILIKKITIRNASIDMFTDSTGYSNSAVFKKSKAETGESSGSFPELKKFELENVHLVIDNRQRGKLYNFLVNDLTGGLNYTSAGWEANVKLNTLVHSMAFSTRKGSFIKEKIVDGKFDIAYNEEAATITFDKNKLEIGGEDFTVQAQFKTAGPTADFSINIENKKIMWRAAAHLLSPNITSRLDMFNLKNPISVKCDIIGDFNQQGDPLIRVNAFVEDNVLDTPGGVVDDCNFMGVFTNNHAKEKGYNDANSAIKLYNFTGNYGGIPFTMKKAFILDLEKPIATGDFTSDFEMAKLTKLIDEDLIKFSTGTASVKINFKADIVDFRLAKPIVSGLVNIKNATISYIPRKLDFKDINVSLDFNKDDLYISKINLKSGKSVVQMEGNIKNFLNLYYTAPEKIVLNWEVYSPQLHLGEFMGFVGTRKRTASLAPASRKGNFTEELNELFAKSNVDMKLRVDKLFYNNFYASDARADILLTDKGFTIKNAALKHADGIMKVDGTVMQGGKAANRYQINATVANVDISKFFKAFDNFGMESLTAANLKGVVSSKASISGRVSDEGRMVPKSMNGTVTFGLKKGALQNFGPVRNVGNIAFPNRNMDNITISSLNGKFDINGELVTIHPMQVNSSVLNMDIAGTYSFGKGTNINVDVPIRNPKRDEGITDEAELAKRRNRGIVLHLVAVDDKDGKVKVKLGKGDKD